MATKKKQKKTNKTPRLKEEVTDANRLTINISKAKRFFDHEDASVAAETLNDFGLIKARVEVAKIGGLFYLTVDLGSESGDHLFVNDPTG